MLATGLRVSYTVDLVLGDIDLVNRIALVRRGKGDKARAVRFDSATAAALDRYKRVRARHTYASLRWLWIGFRGRMTRKGVPAMLNKRSAEAGIRHVHPHQLRHTWADRWLRAGGNEGDLQRLGGWESAEIMRRYGEARAVDRALAAYDNVNPMGKLVGGGALGACSSATRTASFHRLQRKPAEVRLLRGLRSACSL